MLGDWGLSRSIESEIEEKQQTASETKGHIQQWWSVEEEKKTDSLEAASTSGYVSSAGSMTPWPW